MSERRPAAGSQFAQLKLGCVNTSSRRQKHLRFSSSKRDYANLIAPLVGVAQ